MFIKCSRSAAKLVFSDREGLLKPDGSEYYCVTINAENLEASLNVYAFDPKDDGLVKFLAKIARLWRGWDGEEKWISLEGEFGLACNHDGLGHIEIEATLRKPGGWIVQNTFHLVAGELDSLASDVKQFFDLGTRPGIT